MDTTTIILINVGVLTFGIIFYIIWNLMRKNEKLEDELIKRDNYIENITTIMSESDRKIKEIDSKQIFQSDDEIGWFFKNIKDIQTKLERFKDN